MQTFGGARRGCCLIINVKMILMIRIWTQSDIRLIRTAADVTLFELKAS